MSSIGEVIAASHSGYEVQEAGCYCSCGARLVTVGVGPAAAHISHVVNLTSVFMQDAIRAEYEQDERITAWEQVAAHDTLRPCFDEERPLIAAVLDRLSALAEVEARGVSGRPNVGEIRGLVADRLERLFARLIGKRSR